MSTGAPGPHAFAHDSDVLSVRSVTLQPDFSSARVARRTLRDALVEADRESWSEAGELAISEVVANAVLHTGTPIEVSIAVRDEVLEVQVRDFSAIPPVVPYYDEHATTGRGMALVAALASDCGVRRIDGGGKSVWFQVRNGAPEQDAEKLLAAWDVNEPDPTVAGDAVKAVLACLPPRLWLATRQHHDALLRELVLYLAAHDEAPVDVATADSARWLVSHTLATVLKRMGRKQSERLFTPSGRLHTRSWLPEAIDLELRVPPSLGPAYEVLQDTLDRAERLAAAGLLLARPGLPEIIEVRDWVCDQIVAQLAGVPPAPWPGTAQERFETAVHDYTGGNEPEWDIGVVRDSDSGAVAADSANRIIAVSAPLAQRLGWAVDDLVGRRVVTLIPPALREAHVAGFSRHLSTGEANLFGLQLELPVLARDGTQVRCQFLLERGPSNAARAVYIAWIDALE